MANIINKLLNTQLLLAIGMLLAFVGQASYIPDAVKEMLAPFAPIGALLIVIAAVMVLWSMMKK